MINCHMPFSVCPETYPFFFKASAIVTSEEVFDRYVKDPYQHVQIYCTELEGYRQQHEFFVRPQGDARS